MSLCRHLVLRDKKKKSVERYDFRRGAILEAGRVIFLLPPGQSCLECHHPKADFKRGLCSDRS